MAELPKTYDPAAVEPKWYRRWMERGDFQADVNSPKPPFSIVIPPPNITGVLTLGHVLNNTIQDILARRARMLGHEVLWLPGTDHAGVATQTAVEKHLWKTERKSRKELGREEFLRRVVEWQDKHGGIIIEQLKRLGCSCDWSRLRYTFDDAYVRAVSAVFVDLYDKGLIYRGRRMINWDPKAQTALSDEEVIPTKQKGSLYWVRYELVDEPGRFLEVATTRPETIMADTAVAVHPKDARYRAVIGKDVWRPLARGKLPIVADEAIDPEFGTGVLKVTPAHDKLDFEIGQRHKLPIIDVLHADGRINCPAVPDLDGLDRFEARKKAAELLKEQGLLGKEEPYENNVGFSERAGVPIEPRLSEQWFLRYPKTQEALAAVREHLIRFFPQHWEKVYVQWLENIQDWCISRQIWWGHRIPAWYGNVAHASGLRRDEARKPEACATFRGFDEYAELDISRRNLPHWQQQGATYFVTFRLADSLPQDKLAQLEEERRLWLTRHPEPWSDAVRAEYYRRFSAKLDEWLDAGFGSCVLKDERAGRVVADALKHFDGERYELGSWIVMPNHVHAIVTPRAGNELSAILHSWKSFSAHQINKVRGRTGRLWQHETYDHIVRDEEALYRISDYIERNGERVGVIVAHASGLRRDEARKPEACATNEVRVQLESPGADWVQDPDTLDTWFSSWLWAFETMDPQTRAKFYPTSILVTAPDIIFFWVARMIIAGLEFSPGKSERLEENIPFRHVFFTGLIRDNKGRKMSKSLGNSPDPLDLISKYGADGLRFGLMRIAPSGQDIRFDEKQIEEGRNFATKLWNAARFRQMQNVGEVSVAHASGLRPGEERKLEACATLSIYAQEVLARLDETITAIEGAYREYRFNEVAQRLYDFFWSDYCDWYVEAAKTDIFADEEVRKRSALAVMDHVLSAVLRLLHPFMPHVTEELWTLLGFAPIGADREGSIQFASPPKVSQSLCPSDVRERVASIYALVQAGRNLRAESGLPSNKKSRFVLRTSAAWVAEELPTISRLLNAEELVLDAEYQPDAGVPVAATKLGELHLLIAGADKERERERLEKEIVKLREELRTVNAKLANSSFLDRAPAAVVEEHRRRKADFVERLAQLTRARDAL
ncbi:MAG: valine--tRNA ligase [Chthoniobacterales bacterium]